MVRGILEEAALPVNVPRSYRGEREPKINAVDELDD
jgi:hypothetical protein